MELDPSDLLKLPHLDSEYLDDLARHKFTGVSTDSRSTKKGELFVALKGERFDGHQFLKAAAGRGAAIAIIEASSQAELPPGFPVLRVADTTRALGELALLYRRKFGIPILAIAGSNGKTTTKEMGMMVLSTCYRIHGTEGNLNNHIGVPLTLFRLERRHQVSVVEIGTNHPGEIAALCKIVEPTHALVTMIGREHLEFFGSIDGVAKEEGYLYEYIRGKKGTVAFINADDQHVVTRGRGLRNSWRYGFSSSRVRVKGRLRSFDKRGRICFQFGLAGRRKMTAVQLRIPGEHHAVNALAAATVGLAFDISPDRIREALESFKPASKRMEAIQCSGVLVYNDTYNANPDSMLAALATLARTETKGKRIAVLAGMRELGAHSDTEHARIGKEVENLGIDFLLTYGDEARRIHEEAGILQKFHYDQKNVLAEYLAELLSPGDVVLVKGSRSMRMEDVVAFIQERRKGSMKTMKAV
jgi:UDP-N-acetylmuramoyl-tripeptide--D-alanyl-D-alanine ligase